MQSTEEVARNILFLSSASACRTALSSPQGAISDEGSIESLASSAAAFSFLLIHIGEHLERRQVAAYVAAVGAGALVGRLLPGAEELRAAVNPALAVMLFATFLQLPVARLGAAFKHLRFMAALVSANFVAVPLLVAALMRLFPPGDATLQLGVLLVLLTPCVDYVVAFSRMGRADARLMLAATPLLLILQMALLPVYLSLFLGADAAVVVRPGPFLEAFVWLIAVPLLAAAVAQFLERRNRAAGGAVAVLRVLPVPATAGVLFLVIASALPQLGSAVDAALRVAPIYVAFAASAPFIGWFVARLFRLEAPAGRSVAFSAATRNSLVVLPLAYAVPGAVPALPVALVTQTLVELMSELVYVRVLSKLGSRDGETRGATK